MIVKAKQIEYLINSLPEPEPEEDQVSRFTLCNIITADNFRYSQAKRLQELEDEMQVTNAEYIRAVHRASASDLSREHN